MDKNFGFLLLDLQENEEEDRHQDSGGKET